MLGQTRRWRALHQAHGRANMLHRPPLSPSRAFCAPAQWRQAQHKRCHRLCTISRSARNIRGWQLQRLSARRLRGGFASAIPHPIFRACRHCQTLCESSAGIAVDRRQIPAGSWYSRPAENDQRIGQIIQNVPNENARCNPAFPLSKEIGKCFDTAR